MEKIKEALERVGEAIEVAGGRAFIELKRAEACLVAALRAQGEINEREYYLMQARGFILEAQVV